MFAILTNQLILFHLIKGLFRECSVQKSVHTPYTISGILEGPENKESPNTICIKAFNAGPTRLELATSCVTGRRSNQTELRPRIYIFIMNLQPSRLCRDVLTPPKADRQTERGSSRCNRRPRIYFLY